MEIKEINSKEAWEKLAEEFEEKTFLQSFNWGEFQKSLGFKVWRFEIQENSQTLALAQVIKIASKKGNFLFIPHGPMFLAPNFHDRENLVQVLLRKLQELSKKENIDFIRIAPILKRNPENEEIFKNLGFIQAPTYIHPEVTVELDLTLPEEQLFKNLRKTHRNLIRRGLKEKELKIYKTTDKEGLAKFIELYHETAKRHKFVPFSETYLKNEFEIFAKDNQIEIYFAKYKEEIISSAMIVFWQNKAFYHHGASVHKFPKIPTSYLLQWEIILEAKKRGCKSYNFWGIAEKDSKLKKHHRFYGITLFKTGFGGEIKEYVKTQDFPLNKIKYYLLVKPIETLRKIKRRTF